MHDLGRGDQRRSTAPTRSAHDPTRTIDIRGRRDRVSADPYLTYHECRAFRNVQHASGTYRLDCAADTDGNGRHRGHHTDITGRTWRTPDGWW